MKEIEELLPRVLEVCPACPEPTAIRHLRDAAIEFARRTRIWRDYDSFPLTGDSCEVIASDGEAVAFEITHAAVTDPDGTVWELEAKTQDWLDRNVALWRGREGTPHYFTQLAPNTVRVTPQPEAGSSLRLEMILVPAISTDRLPDFLVDTYAQDLADGALARVLLLPTDFTNPDLAAAHAAAFNEALGRWGAQAPRGQQRAIRRTKTAAFF